jgi:hypothetical protein
MDQIKEFLEPVITLLPEPLRDLWLVVLGVIALVILLPLAWYQRRFLRALVGLQPKPPRVEAKLDEYLVNLPPPPPLPGPRRLTVLGLPARLRLVVVAPLGRGATIDETHIDELLNQVRWGLAVIAREDQALVRVWPPQVSAHGFPALFHRRIHKTEPDGQPSRWVLLAGPTPPRPRPVLLGLVLLTDDATNIGQLAVDHSQWMNSLPIEHLEAPEGASPPLGAGLLTPPSPPVQPIRPATEADRTEEQPQPVPKTNGVAQRPDC